MASLNSLFPTSGFITSSVDQVYVFNTSTTTVSNGGRCCLWTVPTGIFWARFEVWGGGSRGPGGCCCQQPAQSGGAGAYARKTIPVKAGDTYRICAGGTTDCSCSCCGTEGFPSYVQTESAVNTINLCARGGWPSCSQCFVFSGGTCCANTAVCLTGNFCGQDFGLPAITGAAMGSTCGYQSYQYVPQGPYAGGGARSSFDYCQVFQGSCQIGGFASFPGGGGGGAVTGSGASCWGSPGAGGLVIVTYG